ncbi:ATP-grasp domain-containing protein [Methylomonas lenta]|nr:ATP-grasp domain-containing protein [Methylomonas lenta]
MNQLPSTQLLVIANSARMLTQMAVDTGFLPIAVDCYADEDTRILALDVVKVASLAVADIHVAIDDLIKKHGVKYLIYGSGFETQLSSLDYLESRFIVLGNAFKLFQRFHDKADFFRNLKLLNINHPESVLSPPDDNGDWLIKPMQGHGGQDVARFDGSQAFSGDFYWQRYQAGETFSVLFVACNDQISVLGFNRQWSCSNPVQEFLFAGIKNHAAVSEENQVLLGNWLQALVELYPMQGLGSLDFIIYDEICYLLEINARIPASAQLYGKSVLNLHLQACMERLPDWDFSQIPAGYQIIYADRSVCIPAGLTWPHWVVDRPKAGVFIGKGLPICSIIASENDADEVENQLQRQQKIIASLLNMGL